MAPVYFYGIVIMIKKSIRIRFVDFNAEFREPDNWLYHWLTSHGYDVVISNKPDYLVFSVFGEEHLKYNDCIKIFFTGECQTPDFNLCDYAIGFDYLDYGDRYLRYPLYLLYRKAMAQMLVKHQISDADIAAKKDFCAFVYSNGRAAEQRINFFHALDSIRKVNSGGKLLNNIGKPVEDKLAFQAKHRFSIAFENTSFPGYTTEKLIEAFASRTIPIYCGDPMVAQDFNPKAFINCADFSSINEVIQRVIDIDNHPELVRQYLREPALRDEHLPEKMNKALDNFLSNIFTQDLAHAKRFNRNYWGARIVQERQRQVNAYHKTLYYRMMRLYTKHIYPIARKHIGLWKITQKLMKYTSRNI